jgi:hypothetical protein
VEREPETTLYNKYQGNVNLVSDLVLLGRNDRSIEIGRRLEFHTSDETLGFSGHFSRELYVYPWWGWLGFHGLKPRKKKMTIEI